MSGCLRLRAYCNIFLGRGAELIGGDSWDISICGSARQLSCILIAVERPRTDILTIR